MSKCSYFTLMIFTLSFLTTEALCQMDTVWTRRFGDIFDDGCKSIIQSNDGNYMVAGYHGARHGVGQSDFWVIKIDSTGDSLWSKTYGGDGYDQCNSIIQASDGGYVLTGWTESFGRGAKDVFVLKISENGDSTWSVIFGGAENDMGICALVDEDNSYKVVGVTASFGSGSFDGLLLKLTPDGEVVEREYFGGDSLDAFTSAMKDEAGNMIIGGTTWSSGFGGEFWLLKIDTEGDLLWQRTFNYDEYNILYSVQNCEDGGFLLAGARSPRNEYNSDFMIMKIDSGGDFIWKRIYGGDGYESCEMTILNQNGGHILAGVTTSFGSGETSVWLININDSGDSLSSKTYGVDEDDNDPRIISAIGGGILLTSTSFYRVDDYLNSDILITRITSDTAAKVHESKYSPLNFHLFDPFPNPFNNNTVIKFAVPQTGPIQLGLYNSSGQYINSISSFVDHPGLNSIVFSSNYLPSGAYWVVLSQGRSSKSRKLIFLK